MRTRDIACGLGTAWPRDRGACRRHRLRQPAGRGRPGPPGHGQVLGSGGRVRRSAPRRSVRPQLPGRGAGRRRPLGQRPGLALRLSRGAAARQQVHGEASPRVEAERRGERPGRGGAAHRAEASSAFPPAARRSSRCSRATAREIEEDQHFLLRLNGPAVEASVLANAWCEVEGIGERLPLVHRRRRAARAAAEGAPHRAGAVAARC